ncbi:MAG: exo-alpha-sialidase [Chloroflexi bacterium]|nr:MAG: exo-alpha-sialidase [Chloroflexota bacterium]
MLEVLASGLVYRNPRPELRPVHTWHPTIVRFEDGELLCTFDLASADVALDYRTYASRSLDDGTTWTSPVRVLADSGNRASVHSVRISRVSDGSVVAFGGRMFRDDPDRGLINVPTLGYTEMELITLRSRDRGRSWEGPVRIDPPLVGPAFEICHAIVELRDGRWLGPTSTWMGWDGAAPNGMNAILLVSHDQGSSWPEYIVEFDRWAEHVLHWEQSVVQLRDGRLLAVAWAVSLDTNRAEPTPYALSEDGREFTVRGFTGFRGQTTKIIELPDGRIFSAYRRDDVPGLWATVARLDGDRWVNQETIPLWQGASSGMSGTADPGHELLQLKFGFPQMVVMPDGQLFLVFWCEEDCIKNIRWLRIAV